jgi:hypothetical protein
VPPKEPDVSNGSCWTEVEFLILKPGDRNAALPSDTASTPYIGRVRGMGAESELGAVVEVTTVVGRRLRGTVVETNPGYTHTFGHPLPEWIRMRDGIRRELSERRDAAARSGES